MKTHFDGSPQEWEARRGFTLVELTVILGVIALLAMILAPGLCGARPDAQVLKCRNNLRQLQAGWQMYSDDFAGAICPTAGMGNPASPQWCFGEMDLETESTNSTLIQQGLLWPYVKSLSSYKCPADPKRNTLGIPTVRSVSINAWLNPASLLYNQGLSAPGRVFRRQSDISAVMSPSMCWILTDENERTINDGWLAVSASAAGPNGTTWIDVPASYHNRGAGLVYADGHTEIKRWRDKGLLNATSVFTPADLSVPPNPPGYGDLVWLRERTTVVP